MGRWASQRPQQDQLMAAQQETSEAFTCITKSMMEKKHAEERFRALEKEFKSSSTQCQKDQESCGNRRRWTSYSRGCPA